MLLHILYIQHNNINAVITIHTCSYIVYVDMYILIAVSQLITTWVWQMEHLGGIRFLIYFLVASQDESLTAP